MRKSILKSLKLIKLESAARKAYHFLKQKNNSIGDTEVKNEMEQNTKQSVTDKIIKLCPELNELSLSIIQDMYLKDFLNGTEQNEPIQIEKTTRISIEQGSMMNSIMRESNVTRSLEIGFAYGFSSVWILDALIGKPNSIHIAIDPFEKSYWHGVGLCQVKKLSMVTNFQWKSELSIHALSKLIESKEKFDFIYIDGNHRFDDVLVDFYLSDQLLEPKGIIAFDDMWMPSIQKVAAFILKNRSYEIIQQNVSNMLVLRKKQNDFRVWNHFINF